MNDHTPFSTFTETDFHRLANWFPVADKAELAARQGDRAAMIDYLSFCNDLTRSEASELLDDLTRTACQDDQPRTLRAA